MATIKDVSRLAGVSISTVSRVINNTAPVTLAKRDAVLQAMAHLNFQPNTFAQALVRKRSDCIGVLLGDLCGGPFFTQMMRGVEHVIAQTNMFTVMTAGHHQQRRERQAIEALRYRQCDGLIVHSRALSDEELAQLVRVNRSVVLINRLIPQIAEHCIYFDNAKGTHLATEFLMMHGHEYIAFINSNVAQCPDAYGRQQGFEQAMNKAPSSQLQISAFPDEGGGYYAMQKLLARQCRFTAIVTFNDAMAAGAMACLQEHKIQIPQDISVIGCDDTPQTRFLYPKLTTIKYPIEEMGISAAQLVLCFLHDNLSQPVKKCFQPTLIQRQSTLPIVESSKLLLQN